DPARAEGAVFAQAAHEDVLVAGRTIRGIEQERAVPGFDERRAELGADGVGTLRSTSQVQRLAPPARRALPREKDVAGTGGAAAGAPGRDEEQRADVSRRWTEI